MYMYMDALQSRRVRVVVVSLMVLGTYACSPLFIEPTELPRTKLKHCGDRRRLNVWILRPSLMLGVITATSSAETTMSYDQSRKKHAFGSSVYPCMMIHDWRIDGHVIALISGGRRFVPSTINNGAVE